MDGFILAVKSRAGGRRGLSARTSWCWSQSFWAVPMDQNTDGRAVRSLHGDY